MAKVTIVGAGNVGATAAHVIAGKDLADVVLVDVADGLAQGKALDLMHLRSIEGFECTVTGSGDYEPTRGSDIIVITAGIARKPGMTREDLLGVNARIMSSVIDEALALSPEAVVICVTNPLDIMTHLAAVRSGLPKQRIMGMGGVLDSARLSFAVCDELGVSPKQVEAWAVGPHGEGMLTWPRFTLVDGEPLFERADAAQLERIRERCVKGGAEVVAFLKTGSAFYAPGASIARMVEAILSDSHEVMSVCALLEGEYGIDGVFMNVPVELCRAGVAKVVEFPLDDDELAALRAAADGMRGNVQAALAAAE